MALDVERIDAAGAVEYERAHPRFAPQSADATLSLSRPATYLVWAAVFGVAIGFNEIALEQLRAGQAHIVGRENGPLEHVQLLVMVPAVVLFGLAWWNGLGAVRVAGALLALLATVATVRETDFKSLDGAHVWLDWLVARELQDGLLALLGLATVLYLFRQRRYFWGLVRLGARWQAWPFALSVMLLATAELYLDGFEGPTGHFWEELVETNGYFLFAVAAWKHWGLVGDPVLDRTV